jgi:hypothetical protein
MKLRSSKRREPSQVSLCLTNDLTLDVEKRARLCRSGHPYLVANKIIDCPLHRSLQSHDIFGVELYARFCAKYQDRAGMLLRAEHPGRGTRKTQISEDSFSGEPIEKRRPEYLRSVHYNLSLHYTPEFQSTQDRMLPPVPAESGHLFQNYATAQCSGILPPSVRGKAQHHPSRRRAGLLFKW